MSSKDKHYLTIDDEDLDSDFEDGTEEEEEEEDDGIDEETPRLHHLLVEEDGVVYAGADVTLKEERKRMRSERPYRQEISEEESNRSRAAFFERFGQTAKTERFVKAWESITNETREVGQYLANGHRLDGSAGYILKNHDDARIANVTLDGFVYEGQLDEFLAMVDYRKKRLSNPPIKRPTSVRDNLPRIRKKYSVVCGIYVKVGKGCRRRHGKNTILDTLAKKKQFGLDQNLREIDSGDLRTRDLVFRRGEEDEPIYEERIEGGKKVEDHEYVGSSYAVGGMAARGDQHAYHSSNVRQGTADVPFHGDHNSPHDPVNLHNNEVYNGELFAAMITPRSWSKGLLHICENNIALARDTVRSFDRIDFEKSRKGTVPLVIPGESILVNRMYPIARVATRDEEHFQRCTAVFESGLRLTKGMDRTNRKTLHLPFIGPGGLYHSELKCSESFSQQFAQHGGARNSVLCAKIVVRDDKTLDTEFLLVPRTSKIANRDVKEPVSSRLVERYTFDQDEGFVDAICYEFALRGVAVLLRFGQEGVDYLASKGIDLETAENAAKLVRIKREQVLQRTSKQWSEEAWLDEKRAEQDGISLVWFTGPRAHPVLKPRNGGVMRTVGGQFNLSLSDAAMEYLRIDPSVMEVKHLGDPIAYREQSSSGSKTWVIRFAGATDPKIKVRLDKWFIPTCTLAVRLEAMGAMEKILNRNKLEVVTDS
ncbi:uncharacterized protein JCM6883_007260 [Sporobolomyces salmoneus]|uniref:uncharacterized protein n=1 Tax=Sporobolomyces salmoneus TaxID=183962 RepID=UPI003174E796